MGIELELAVLLIGQTIGTSIFAPFEVETPVWRKLAKWGILILGTLALTRVVGHWAVIFPFGLASVGLVVHFVFVNRHGIHPFKATPRRKYYELRGWKWIE